MSGTRCGMGVAQPAGGGFGGARDPQNSWPPGLALMVWPGSRAAPAPHPKWERPSLEWVEEQLSLILVPSSQGRLGPAGGGGVAATTSMSSPRPEAIWKCGSGIMLRRYQDWEVLTA